jgi:tetratricopeptide (TPR) repeat protein
MTSADKDEAAGARTDSLLADANRLRAKGDLEAAAQRCRQALILAPGSSQAHELLGDVLYQQRLGDEAIEHYRLARAGNPQRLMLEDKIGRASLLIAQKDILRLRAEDLLRGKREEIPRRPGIAAVLSLFVPGFGQIYNREHVKGAVLVCVWLMLILGAAGTALGSLRQGAPGGGLGLVGLGLGAVFAVFFSRPTLWWTLLSAAVWMYGIADAAIQAAKTMTAPEDLA